MEQIKDIDIKRLELNKGQVEGLPKNPRFIRDERYKALVKSIEDAPEMLKLRELLVVEHGNKFVVIGGNMRLRACKELGMETVPCKVLPADTPTAKLREYAIKDNNGFGEDDWDALANEWDAEELQDWGMELPMDWDVDGQGDVTATEDDFDESEVTETVCKRGEVWKLGEHRLMCGDSTSEEDFAKLMGEERADMVFTDPPYGIDYSGGRTQVVGTKEYGKLKNDNLQGEALGNLICNVFKHNKAGADVYICVSPIMQKPFLDYIESQGKQLNAVIVWDKKAPGLGYMAYRRQCEFILFIKGGAFHKGDKSDIDLWRIGRDDATTYVHGTQKPIGVSGRAITNSSKEGDIILDYFGGSGSTMIACEQLGRKCRMMELDPHYCDVIIARWEKLTGQKAVKL